MKCLFLTVGLVASQISGCGSDKKDDAPVVVYGSMTIAGSTSETDNAAYDLTTLTTCSRNADTGRVDVALSLSSGVALTVAIKNYSSTAKAYTCSQAADNRESTTDVGGKFENCMVEAKGLSTKTATTVNGYSMYREAISTKPFTYGGACTVTVTEASPAIKATLDCADTVQTVLEGTARNPINAAINADITGSLNCTFQ